MCAFSRCLVGPIHNLSFRKSCLSFCFALTLDERCYLLVFLLAVIGILFPLFTTKRTMCVWRHHIFHLLYFVLSLEESWRNEYKTIFVLSNGSIFVSLHKLASANRTVVDIEIGTYHTSHRGGKSQNILNKYKHCMCAGY